MTPEATKKGHLFLRIELEVTSVAFPDAEAANGETIPTFHTRQVNTSAAMRRGDTLVVTGLVTPEQKQEFAQLPHLAQIPIIGRLWKSEDFRQGKTDLIFFLTPMVEGQQAKMEVLGGA